MSPVRRDPNRGVLPLEKTEGVVVEGLWSVQARLLCQFSQGAHDLLDVTRQLDDELVNRSHQNGEGMKVA